MGTEDDEKSVKKLEIEDDIEGGREDSNDYFFDRVGKPIPIVQGDAYQAQSPPSRPLAVSEHHRLIFVAHSSGFCVARTKDVMDASEEIKAKGTSTSIKELSIVDVPLENVNILSLSTDSSTLAVSVAADVHFFSVDSLLKKDLNPSLSCSLSESSAFIKDMIWRRRLDMSFLVLSNHGKLYHGALGASLKDVMDNVDAVEWSLKGKYIAVARENILSILSSKFRERLRISLSFKSWLGDSEENCCVKVDTIRWVRPDSIIIGCFQQTADGKEENYLIQVIRSKDGKITDASSKPFVLSFYDLFPGLIDDIVPHGNGPYLFLSYLEQWALAITANRKNIDQHIQLLRWSVDDDMNETSVIDIDRDTWVPRIELQGNGDDNLIMGLCIDKVSLFGKIKAEVGLEQKELSPYCVLFCVTLEGKLVIFYVASATRLTIPPEDDFQLHDEEEDSLSDVPAGCGLSMLRSGLGKQTLEQVDIDRQLKDESKGESNIKVDEIPSKTDRMPSGKGDCSMALLVKEQASCKNSIHKGHQGEPVVNFKPFVADGQENVSVTKLHHGIEGQQPQIFYQQSAKDDFQLHDEEEDSLSDVPGGCGLSMLRSGLGKQTLEQVDIDRQLKDESKGESNIGKVDEIPSKTDRMPSGKGDCSMALLVKEQASCKDSIHKGHQGEPVVNFKPFVAGGQENVSVTKLHHGIEGQQPQIFYQQSAKVGQSSLKSLSLVGPSYFDKHSRKAETQIVSEFRSDPASILKEVPTDVPSQLNGKDLQKSDDLPEGSRIAIGSTGLQGATSETWSSGKVMYFGGYESRASPLISTLVQGNKYDNTGVTVDSGNISVELVGKPFHQDVISRSSTNLSVRPTQSLGQKALVTGPIEPLPSIRNSQLPSQESFALGKYSPYSSKDAHKVPSLSNSEPYLSRQFGNIKEMAKELDSLLQCIEEPGGFRDACTVSQRSSIEALEEHMQILSEKCRMQKSMMDEQLGEIKHLLDKTVQVLARKIYVDGIVKQASDSQYWELWNRQKLSSELELKRRHILKLNQVLTNQLIELERHFNALELHKFGEKGIYETGQRALKSRYGPSRQVQSLRTLHNTTYSQLAAAEQLSECLSKQMAILSIESPVKQKNVKKELFETIGIPYDPTFSSPDASKVGDSPSLNKLLISSGSAANKSQSRRRQSSAMNSSYSETARRRRESLDQSLVSFEPTKTTVKRVLLQESQRKSVNKSSMMDRQQRGPSLVDSSAVNHPKDLTSPSTLMYSSGNKGIQHMVPKQAFINESTPSKWANDSPPQSQSTSKDIGLRPRLQSNNAVLPAISPSQTLPVTAQIIVKEASNITADKSSVGKSDSVLINDTRSIQQSEASLHKKSLVPMGLTGQTPMSMKKSSEMKGIVLTNSTIETVNHVPTSTKSYDSSFPLLPTAVPVDPSYPGKVPQFNVAASGSQPSAKTSSLQAFSMSLSVSSSPMVNPSLKFPSSASTLSSIGPSLLAAMPFGTSSTTSKDNIDVSQIGSLTSLSSVFPSSSLSLEAPKSLSPLRTPPPVSESYKTELQSSSGTELMTLPVNPTPPPPVSESLKTDVQLPAGKPSVSPTPTLVSVSSSPLASVSAKSGPSDAKGKFSSRTDVNASVTVPSTQLDPPAFSLKHASPVSSVTTTEISTQLGSGSRSSLNIGSPVYGIELNVQPKEPADAPVLFGATLASDNATSGKNSNLDVTTEEDEMEEEAPETNCANEISLGNLGAFGLGSTPSSTAPRANPFGGSFGNIGTNQASSSFTMTVPSGELFRPASFSFQSPQPSQPAPPTNLGAFSGGFGAGAAGAAGQAPAPNGFGQPAHIGAGQAALGSVLGSFGQSRQFGASTSPIGGFSSAATSGGFAGLASGGVGFAGVALGAGGFGGMGSASGGFAAAAAPGGGSFAASGGGFGAFNNQQGAGGFSAFSGNAGGNQQGNGGFSAFGGNAGGIGKPAELFTQMRK